MGWTPPIKLKMFSLSPAPSPVLERAIIPWLILSGLVVCLPHVGFLPVWTSTMIAGLLAYRFILWLRGESMPRRWQVLVLTFAGVGGIGLEYHSWIGPEAGVAFLALLYILKLQETRTQRDAMVLTILGYLLLLTHYLSSQTLLTGGWMFVALFINTATMVRVHAGTQVPVGLMLRHTGLLLVQGIPLMLVLFILFPRLQAPLWSMPSMDSKRHMGLSESMAPGSISELMESAEIAFRVRFEGETPPARLRYWRGPVLDRFNGRTWTQSNYLSAPQISYQGPSWTYEMTLEPHQQQWLLAMDYAERASPDTLVTRTFSLISRQPVMTRERLKVTSFPEAIPGINENPTILRETQALPARGNPRARALAEAWKQEAASPEALVNRALQYFRQEPFVYTLKPPLLQENGIDQFLFDSRRGFCEHYAGAFVFLMRAAGLSARVVTGYQGGEENPVDGYLVVRQSDAHAWAELWIPGQGWRRVDPTAAVAPNRIERGVANALPAGEILPASLRPGMAFLKTLRLRWEAANNTWNQWVLGYNQDRQQNLLSNLGINMADWKSLGGALLLAFALITLPWLGWLFRRQYQTDPVQRAWRRLCQHLARRGLPRHPWEAPGAYARRTRLSAGKDCPKAVAVLLEAATLVDELCYGPPLDPKAVRTRLRRLEQLSRQRLPA